MSTVRPEGPSKNDGGPVKVINVRHISMPIVLVGPLLAIMLGASVSVTLVFASLQEKVAANTSAVVQLANVYQTSVDTRLRGLETRTAHMESSVTDHHNRHPDVLLRSELNQIRADMREEIRSIRGDLMPR